ncbi:MAG TPA: hypothetical protein VFN36_07190 [Solirubrobacteraceae bacterium]|nr:hypothetical protein [Solirubrobacteraceae bacterium]
MTQAELRQMSEVREQHAAHPHRPRPARKPGVPQSASTAHAARAGRDGSGDAGGPADGRPEPRSDAGARPGSSGTDGLERVGGDGREPVAGDGSSLPSPRLPGWARLALRLLGRLGRHELRRLATRASLPEHLPPAASEAVERLGRTSRTIEPRRGGLGTARPSLPIQESVEVAVPLEFAWRRWMDLAFLPEGVDEVTDITRSGDGLRGRVEGGDWAAEILDEREQESFAWRSTAGSDCAGLVTFHRLGERLTRIELTLDVMPRDLAETALLLTHLADRRALRRLRRFKAELEVVSPDVYAGDGAPPSR